MRTTPYGKCILTSGTKSINSPHISPVGLTREKLPPLGTCARTCVVSTWISDCILRLDRSLDLLSTRNTSSKRWRRSVRAQFLSIVGPKVNQHVAAVTNRPEILEDPRFTRMWSDNSVKVDTGSDAYKRMRPSGARYIEAESEEEDEDQD